MVQGKELCLKQRIPSSKNFAQNQTLLVFDEVQTGIGQWKFLPTNTPK